MRAGKPFDALPNLTATHGRGHRGRQSRYPRWPGFAPARCRRDVIMATQYGERYFRQYSHEGDTPYRRDDPVWTGFFGEMARQIIAQLKPRTVLDAGCAMGLLVEVLRDRGVEAWGIDFS